jgi:hypothetical protein
LGRSLALWSSVFLAYWSFTTARTWVSSTVPLIHAALFARDFAYFALLLPLLFGVLRRPTVRAAALVTLAAGASVAALAQSAVVISHASLSVIVHTYVVQQTEGLTRLTTSAIDLPAAALPLGLGLCLLGKGRVRRLVGAGVAVVSLIAVLVGLTRAIYLGEIIGLGVATGVWLGHSDGVAASARRRLAYVLAVGAIVVGFVTLYSPPSATSTAVTGVSHRVVSLVTDLSANATLDASVRARQTEYARLEQLLVGHWTFGLGFLEANYHYVPGLPNGSIRSPDVGVFNILETMGLVGAVLYALPLLGILIAMCRWPFTRRASPDTNWVAFGVLAWCIAAIVTAPTLLWFFDRSQVVSSATMLALGVAIIPARALPGTAQKKPGLAATNTKQLTHE